MRVKWRGKPVWILRRTEAALPSLSEVEGHSATRVPGRATAFLCTQHRPLG